MAKNYAQSTLIGSLLERLAEQSRHGYYELNTTPVSTLLDVTGTAIIYNSRTDRIVHSFVVNEGQVSAIEAYEESMIDMPEDRGLAIFVQHDTNNKPYIRVIIHHLDTGKKSVAVIKEGLWQFEEQ